MADAFAVSVFLLLALPPALVLLDWPRAVLAAGLFSGVAATVAAMLHVLVNVPIVIVWIVLFAASYAVIGFVPRVRAAFLRHLRVRPVLGDWIQLGIVAALILVSAVWVPAPVDWDARSIWLFHASWLTGPASDFYAGQSLPTVAFSHPNYPLFAPASIAVVWGLAGTAEDLQLGLRLVAVVTILSTAFAASIAIKRLAPAVSLVVSTIAFTLFTTAVFTVSSGLFNHGYVDALQACLVVGVAALLLPALGERLGLRASVTAAVVAIAAINVKQEGMPFVAIVLVVFLVLTVRDQYLLKYLPIAAAGAFYLVWKVFLAIVGSNDTSDASGIVGRLGELLDYNSTAWIVIRHIGVTKGYEVFIPFLIPVLIAAVAIAWAKPGWPGIRQGLFLVLSWLGIVAVIVLTYALGDTRDRIDWWLLTSFDRVVGTVQLLAWFTIFVAVIVVSPWRAAVIPQKTGVA